MGAQEGFQVGRIALADDLMAERANWKRSGARVVFVHGVFDLLHPGHVRLLEQARSLGDVLVVAVYGDASERSSDATAIAGANDRESESLRSVTPLAERAEIVAALAAVDFVFEMDWHSILEFAYRLMPGALVKGASSGKTISRDEELRAEEIVKGVGGKVIIIPLEPGYSRASLMERIRQAGA
jgi:rfaE bifunctional protein nucleotidyltransferase chain/domain